MNVDMFTLLDIVNDLSDVMPVLDYTIGNCVILESDFMAERNILKGLHFDVLLGVHIEPLGHIACLDINGGNADCVGFFMN
jgi:hypothetical protein